MEYECLFFGDNAAAGSCKTVSLLNLHSWAWYLFW